MNNNQDYCSYELSKALKACGFDEPCIAQWACEPDGKPILVGSTAFVFSNAKLKGRDVTSPSLWQAQKWLREQHHISIRVSYLPDSRRWFADWLNLDSGDYDDTDATSPTYEEALADGINMALGLIHNPSIDCQHYKDNGCTLNGHNRPCCKDTRLASTLDIHCPSCYPIKNEDNHILI